VLGSSEVVDSESATNEASGSSRSGRKSSTRRQGMPSSAFDEKQWLGKQLGRFTIRGVLGKGAMGVVYKAHDADLKRNVALKILTKQFVQDKKRTFRLEQFIREARSAAKLQHPHSVTVYEIGKDQGWYFIAMELVEGGTLFDLVRKKGKLPIEQACELVAEAADALSAAHRVGIVHRDIKPSNLMISKDGRVKVTDFGLAELSEPEDDFELPTKAVGTPYWMSPEQCKGEASTGRSDIYALGAVLYYAITGEVPFPGKTKPEILKKHVSAPPPDPRRYRKDVPETLVRILNRCLAKNPLQRYQDAAELAIGLRQVASAVVQAKLAERRWGQLATSVRTGAPATVQGTWNLMTVLLGIVALALGAMVVWQFYHQPSVVERVEYIDRPMAVPVMPVVAEKGSRLYHYLRCKRIEGVPEDELQVFMSESEAKAKGLTACQFCQKQLAAMKQRLGIKEQPPTATQPEQRAVANP